MKRTPSVVSILSAPAVRLVTAHFTPPGGEELSVVLNDTTIDTEVLVKLKNISQSPKIIVTVSPGAPDQALLLKDFELPLAIRTAHDDQHDRLIAVRLVIKASNTVTQDESVARGSDGLPTRAIRLTNVDAEFVIGNGRRRSSIPVSARASLLLPSGIIRLL